MTEQRNPPATALQRDSRDGRVPKSLVSERMFGYSGGGPAQAKRGVRICRGENGWGRIVITLSDLEVEEFASALQAFIDLRYRPGRPVDESPGGDFADGSADGSAGGDPVDESTRRDCQPPVGLYRTVTGRRRRERHRVAIWNCRRATLRSTIGSVICHHGSA